MKTGKMVKSVQQKKIQNEENKAKSKEKKKRNYMFSEAWVRQAHTLNVRSTEIILCEWRRFSSFSSSSSSLSMNYVLGYFFYDYLFPFCWCRFFCFSFLGIFISFRSPSNRSIDAIETVSFARVLLVSLRQEDPCPADYIGIDCHLSQ